MKKKRIFIGGIALLLLMGTVSASIFYYYLFAPQFRLKKTAYIYIDRDDTVDSVYNKVKQKGNPRSFTGFQWMMQYKKYSENLHTGRYAIRNGENIYHVFSRLYRGYQEPTNLTIGSVRTLDKLVRNVAKQLMIDSTEISNALYNPQFLEKSGYTLETLPSLFIPDTYQIYWNMNAEEFISRMLKEHNKFWNQERLNKATTLGMTPAEISTLASIVEEETNNNAEKPVVAGLYINRLMRNMPLQADPTVKFALQDFGLRRIINSHLSINSPYNTYLNTGLPPGPIRIPSPIGLDAVLNYTKHNYIYMCAKEDFSGTHNFASNLADHNRNARKYWNALNERKIYK